MELIVNNLLSNAFKYTPDEKSISLSVTCEKQILCLQVKDEGRGINAQKLNRLFTDTVAVNYRGKLINGTVFDQSYKGELNPSIAVPVEFPVSDVIVGWTTALMNMTVGSRWELYIPSELAYEEAGSGSIPGYSTLFFCMWIW